MGCLQYPHPGPEVWCYLYFIHGYFSKLYQPLTNSNKVAYFKFFNLWTFSFSFNRVRFPYWSTLFYITLILALPTLYSLGTHAPQKFGFVGWENVPQPYQRKSIIFAVNTSIYPGMVFPPVYRYYELFLYRFIWWSCMNVYKNNKQTWYISLSGMVKHHKIWILESNQILSSKSSLKERKKKKIKINMDKPIDSPHNPRR